MKDSYWNSNQYLTRTTRLQVKNPIAIRASHKTEKNAAPEERGLRSTSLVLNIAPARIICSGKVSLTINFDY